MLELPPEWRRGQKAIIAIANKMLKIIWVIPTRKEPYHEGMNQDIGKSLTNRIRKNNRLAKGKL